MICIGIVLFFIANLAVTQIECDGRRYGVITDCDSVSPMLFFPMTKNVDEANEAWAIAIRGMCGIA